jgi:hypothetical protein
VKSNVVPVHATKAQGAVQVQHFGHRWNGQIHDTAVFTPVEKASFIHGIRRKVVIRSGSDFLRREDLLPFPGIEI